MTKQLTGTEFNYKEDIGNGIYSYVFNAEEADDIRVVWSNEDRQIKE